MNLSLVRLRFASPYKHEPTTHGIFRKAFPEANTEVDFERSRVKEGMGLVRTEIVEIGVKNPIFEAPIFPVQMWLIRNFAADPA